MVIVLQNRHANIMQIIFKLYYKNYTCIYVHCVVAFMKCILTFKYAATLRNGNSNIAYMGIWLMYTKICPHTLFMLTKMHTCAF